MARAQKNPGEEFIESSGGDIPDVNLPPLVNEAPIKGDATQRNLMGASSTDTESTSESTSAETTAAATPAVRYFRVERGGYILQKGYRTRLREGKVVDSLNYDLKKLVTQGIKLTEVSADAVDTSYGSTFDGLGL